MFKSYSFWTALAGAITIFVSALGKCFGFAVDNDLVTEIIMSFAGILVVFGIVTMPNSVLKNQQKEEDKKEEEEDKKEEEEDKKEEEEKEEEQKDSKE